MSLKQTVQADMSRELLAVAAETHVVDMQITKAYNESRDDDAAELEEYKDFLLAQNKILVQSLIGVERQLG